MQAYELDPAQTFKNQGCIQLAPSQDLLQFQVVENLLCVHCMDSRQSLLFDLKLEDWFRPLASADLRVELGPAVRGEYLTEKLAMDEQRYQQVAATADVISSRMSMHLGTRDSLSFAAGEQEESKTAERPEEAKQAEEAGHNADQTQGKIKIEGTRQSQKETKMQNIDLREIDFYNENLVFIDPMIIVDPANCSCYSIKLKLNSLAKTCTDPLRMLLSLICRQKNRYLFLEQLKESIVNQKINLQQVSAIFTKLTGVYKQASLER